MVSLSAHWLAHKALQAKTFYISQDTSDESVSNLGVNGLIDSTHRGPSADFHWPGEFNSV